MVGVVGGLPATVVLVVDEVVEVGRLVDDVERGDVVEVVVLLGASAAVLTVGAVEVVVRAGRAGLVVALVDVELSGTVVVVGATRPESVVDVTELVVDEAPLAVREGVWGDCAPEVDVVEAVLGTAPGGASGTVVVVVVDDVLVTTGWSVGVGKLVVVGGTEVVGNDGVVVEVVGLVVVVVLVVDDTVVVDEVVGAVVVVVAGVVVVRSVLVVEVVVVDGCRRGSRRRWRQQRR